MGWEDGGGPSLVLGAAKALGAAVGGLCGCWELLRPIRRAVKEISHQVLLWKQGVQPGFWQPVWSLASGGVTHRPPMSPGSPTSTH